MQNNKHILTVAMISEHGDPLSPLGGQQSGGQNVYVYELAKNLSRLGVKVDVFTRWESRKAVPMVRFAQRAKIIRLKAGPRNFIPKDDFGSLMPEFVEHFLEFCRERKAKYDLIHSHYYYSGWAGLRLSSILNIPLIHTSHSLGLLKRKALGEEDSSPKDRYKIEKELMEKATKVVVTSPQEKLDMINQYKVSNKNAVIIPPGTNLNNFYPLDKIKARKKIGIDENKHVVVFVSKMEKRKGGLTLLKAMAEIRKNWPNVYKNLEVYFSSGDPRKSRSKAESDYDKEIIKTINRNNLDSVIRYMKGLTRDTLHYYYGSADVVVMPSYYEPFGMVATEAMATGTPVVASNVGGLKWNVEEGITGFHAEPQNPKSFARQIVKILKHPDLAKRLGENGVVRVKNNFSWKVVTDKMLKLYLDVSKRKV